MQCALQAVAGLSWPATVSLIEPLGDETLVFLDYGGQLSLVAKVDAAEKLAVGDRRSFTFRRDRIVLFDGVTGGRLSA
jgi:ABC-type sugar transport system ATPase subunit